MPAPYEPKAIANAFLQRAFNQRKPLTHLALQKLIFLAHGYHLAKTGVPLINEPFEAWDYGPVCRTLYEEFRECGKAPVTRLATEQDWQSESDVPVPAPVDDTDAVGVIDFVFNTYGDYTPFQLSDMSHKEGWAWDRTRKQDKWQLKNVDISNDWIRDDFAPYLLEAAA